MNFDIRNMRADDLSAVLEIEQTAFHVKNQRDPLFLNKYLEMFPPGCLVATVDNIVCGFVFSHKNGPIGWLGLLAVHPEFQRQTIGKTLFLESTAVLRSQTEASGLQLPAESSALSEFVIKSGYQFVEPQIILSAKTSVLKAYKRTLPEFSLEWDDIFNVSVFSEKMNENDLTSTIKLENSNLQCGSIILETKSRRQSQNLSVGVISAGGCLRNLSCSPMACGLSLTAEQSEELGCNELFFALNSFYNREIEWLCNNGCKIRKIVQKFVYSKSIPRYKQLLSRPQVDLTNWSI